MVRTLMANPEFRFVANGEGAIGAVELALIERHRYQLSDRVDAAHFDEDALRAALEERLEGLAGGGGALEKRWLPNDPTGEKSHLWVSNGEDPFRCSQCSVLRSGALMRDR